MQLLETKDGRERFAIKVTAELATAVTFSADSSLLLTGAGCTDSTIQIWSGDNGAAAGLLEGHRR